MGSKRSGRKPSYIIYLSYDFGDYYLNTGGKRFNLGSDIDEAKERAARSWGISPTEIKVKESFSNDNQQTPVAIAVSRPTPIISAELEALESRRDKLTDRINELLIERQGAHIEGTYHYCAACGINIVSRPARICFRCNPISATRADSGAA